MDGRDVSWLKAGMEAEIEFEVFGSPFIVRGVIRESVTTSAMSLLIGNSTITYSDGRVSSSLLRVISPEPPRMTVVNLEELASSIESLTPPWSWQNGRSWQAPLEHAARMIRALAAVGVPADQERNEQ